jgi:hypothetical protein
MGLLVRRAYTGESHYWVMTPTIDSLIKTGVLTELAPSRVAVLAEAGEAFSTLYRFCTERVTEQRQGTHVSQSALLSQDEIEDEDGGLLAMVAALMATSSTLAPAIREGKILWKCRIDESPSGRWTTRDAALLGQRGVAAQSKAFKKLSEELFRVALASFPRERWPSPPPGARLFQSHGRRGVGATFIVDDQQLMGYARNVAGHFRDYFRQKDESGNYISQFADNGAAQLFNFDQILEARSASRIVPAPAGDGHTTAPVVVSLIGDSLKEPFWPQGTGVNRGILGALDSIWLLHRSVPMSPQSAKLLTKTLN